MRLSENKLNKLDNIINECISEVLYENKLRGNILMENKSINITNDIRSYLKMANMGEMGDADMSKRACELHERLMDMMDLYHFEPEDREMFAQLLSFFSKLLKLNTNVAIYADGSENIKYIIDDNEPEWIDTFHGIEEYDAIVYKTREGAIADKVEYIDHGWNDYSTSMSILHAHLDDSIINKIKSMGLVPALFITGSFHDKFLYAVGILPSEAYKFDEKGGIYFDCKF